MTFSSAAHVRRLLESLEGGAELDADEQAELGVKVRYGVGAAQLEALAVSGAEVGRGRGIARLPVAGVARKAPRLTPGSAEAQAAAVARLGRGHGMGRRWGGW